MRSSSLATWHHILFIPLFLVLCSIYSIHGLDSGAHTPNYKFGIVNGAPEMISNASEIIENVASFDECVDKCSQESTCILAYQANSTDPCYLFQWNSIQQVVKNESGGVGQVAFKVFTDQPSCELNLPLLLNGKIYQLYPNDTSEFLWKIDTSENGWTITYIGKRVEQQPLICGNFTSIRPYPDSCDPKCEVTMVQVYAVPGPLTSLYNVEEKQTWNECLYFCHGNPSCFVVHFYDDLSIKCRWWSIDRITFLNRTEARTSNGIHMAVKVVLSKKTCKMTTEQLLDDQYYLPYNRILQAYGTSFFRVRTTPKYYKINSYLKETKLYVRSIPGCEANTVPSMLAVKPENKKYNEALICLRLHNTPNITQAAANELCREMDGHLLTERFRGFVADSCMASSLATMPWSWLHPLHDNYGFGEDPFSPGRDVKIWFGLEKDQSSGQFKWQDPSQIISSGAEEDMCSQSPLKLVPTKMDNPNPMSWASGQPNMAPGFDCGYMSYKPELKLPFPGYGLYSARCDDVADGFACGVRTQIERGIPTYQSIVDEYGKKTIVEEGDYQTKIFDE